MSVSALSAQAVADLVGGRLLGDGAVVLRSVAPLDRAGPESLSLAVSRAYIEALRATRAGAVLVPEMLAAVPEGPAVRIVVPDPARALTRAMQELYFVPPRPAGIDPTVRIGRGARLGADVCLDPYVVIGEDACLGARTWVGAHGVIGDGVALGDDCELGAHVTCYPGTTVGARVRVKAGTVLGGEGFGFHSGQEGHTRIPHVGRCLIGDDVEIGSSCTVDRGSIDDTLVGSGTKIDNQVHVGHNVRIGRHCMLMGGVGLGGSTHIGDGAILAGHVGVIDHIDVGAGARIGAGSHVMSDVPEGATWSGSPARPHRETLRAQAAALRLPHIIAAIERLVNGKRNDA